MRTLHPLVAGRAFEWTPRGGCRAMEAVHEEDVGAVSSPIRAVFATGQPQRNWLDVGRASNPYLDEMASLGMTDVLAIPFSFISGEVHAIAFATDQPEGSPSKRSRRSMR